jgi:hypothetical protein
LECSFAESTWSVLHRKGVCLCALQPRWELSTFWLCPNANGGKGEIVGKVIEFYIPVGFRFKAKGDNLLETSRVIEFPSGNPTTFRQAAWIFPEVDADLAMQIRAYSSDLGIS